MGIDFPNSPSAGDTYTYEGETYRYNGVAFVKVRDRVTTFNGATGAIIGVTSVQGKTGDVTLTDLEITHGVETFNGLSGSIDTTSLVLPVTGLSASGGVTLSGDLSIAGDIITQDDNLAIRTTSGELMINFLGSQTIINNTANDQDIRVKGNGDSQLFFADAGNNRVGIGTETPTEKLDVTGTIKATTGITLGAGGITFADGTFLSSEAQIAFKNESNTFTQNNTFSTNQIFSNGTGIGTDSDLPSIRFNSNNLVTLGDPEEGSNGVKLTVSDSAQLVTVSDANFKASQSIQVGSSIYHDGDADTILTFGTNTIDIKAGNSSNLSLDTSKTKSGVLFNAAAGISMDTAGITFADGTFQKTAAKSGYRYVIDTIGSGALSSTPSAGTIDVTQQFAGIIDRISIHDTDADGNDISSLLSIFADAGGYLQVMTADNLELFVAHISPADLADANLTHTFGSDVFVLQHTSDGIEMIGLDTFESGDEVFVTIVPASSAVTGMTDGTRGTTNALSGFMFLDGSPVNSGGLSAGVHSNFNRLFIDDEVKLNLKGVTLGTGHLGFNDGTLQQTATKDVGTFTISASSAISTGAKADALHRIPYNATLTKFELKSKATGGMTAAVYIAGDDFGNPTSGFVTGATAETAGLTGETTTFGTASVNEGDFVYLHVLANASGATAAQAFVSYETRA